LINFVSVLVTLLCQLRCSTKPHWWMITTILPQVNSM